ncbi:uncharacterized protein [Halyomorpha halys]|uniref:uncharacterized protein n=1 Tax=Halyomorpha halys TaxID=286706 RepID=UPI0006D4EB9E|nr:uncharacterized protein LOC106687035 [Halyomorpha halys]
MEDTIANMSSLVDDHLLTSSSSSSEDDNISTSSESSNEDDENTKLIKEAAQCDYIYKLFNNCYKKKCIRKPRKKIKLDSPIIETTAISSHQVYLAKKLSERLDNLLEVVEAPISTPNKSSSSSIKGIRLLNDSVCIDEVEEDTVTRKCPVDTSSSSYKEYKARAKEVAVTCDWVLSTANTSLWSSNKKPQLINLKVVKKLPEEKLECDIVSKINIPEKFNLI